MNENDTVAIEELRFGDNDTIIRTRRFLNIRGVFVFIHRRGWFVLLESNERSKYKTKIQVVDDINKLMSEVDVASGAGSAGGTGGMVTKLTAANCRRCWV